MACATNRVFLYAKMAGLDLLQLSTWNSFCLTPGNLIITLRQRLCYPDVWGGCSSCCLVDTASRARCILDEQNHVCEKWI
jgi:hypothetical protein